MKQQPQVLYLGDVVSKWRAMSRVGQREAGKIIGISAASICRIENGEMVPDGKNLMLIFQWLMSPVKEKK